MAKEREEVVMRLPNAGAKPGKRFDYRGQHRYYIRLLAYGSHAVFLERKRVIAVLDALREASWKYHFDVYAYCFLPSELVMIARGKEESSNMKVFLAAFRAGASASLEQELGHPLWKRTYQERVLRKAEQSRDVAREIFRLPVKAGLVRESSQYEYQGSFVLEKRS